MEGSPATIGGPIQVRDAFPDPGDHTFDAFDLMERDGIDEHVVLEFCESNDIFGPDNSSF